MKKETEITRRNFLKGSVMGAGALTAGFGAGLITSPRTAHAALPGYLPMGVTLDVELVRKLAWYHYFNNGG